MQDPIPVLLLGTGNMGSEIARVVLGKPGLDLVGAYGRRPERAGLDLGRVIGMEHELGIAIRNELAGLLEEARPRVAIQATCSTVADASSEITTLLERGVHVISIAEEMVYPAAGSPDTAQQLHRLARDHRVSVLGTGVNPGFVLDLLIITLTGICTDIKRISARRTNDLAPYGHSVLKSQGVGLSREKFYEYRDTGSIVGHVGFRESIHMIAAAVGWHIDRIDQTVEPIIARAARVTPLVTVAPGHVAGCLHTAAAYAGGERVIDLVHPQQVCPRAEGIETGDNIQIDGEPGIQLNVRPEIPGAIATSALAVNMIPRVLNAEPGLHTMADLPVPSAMLADAREFVIQPARMMI